MKSIKFNQSFVEFACFIPLAALINWFLAINSGIKLIKWNELAEMTEDIQSIQ